MISFNSSNKNINVVVPDPTILFWIATSVADINLKSTKTFLANGLSTSSVKGKPGFIKGPRSLPKILLVVPFETAEFFENFIVHTKWYDGFPNRS